MVVLAHLLQDTERTIIPYLNKEETLEGLLNDGYRTWKNKLTNHPLWSTKYIKGHLGFNTLYLFQKNIILRSSLVVNLEVGFHISVPNRVYKIADLQVPDCDKIFFFFYFLQQILNKIDNYIPGMFPYTDAENDWIKT